VRIGVDFDRVLFDTEEFKQYLENEIPDFLDTYGLATGQGYNPEKHAEIMDIDTDRIYDTLDYSEGRSLRFWQHLAYSYSRRFRSYCWRNCALRNKKIC
jgi:hypothetical protein